MMAHCHGQCVLEVDVVVHVIMVHIVFGSVKVSTSRPCIFGGFTGGSKFDETAALCTQWMIVDQHDDTVCAL